jgi:hypothetical protein
MTQLATICAQDNFYLEIQYPVRFPHRLSASLTLPWMLLALTASPLARAAPRIPDSDSAVLERLPVRANDPTGRELRRLRETLAANPRDARAAERLARKYFDLASAEGDPRYIGYAEAALRPWSTADGWTADAPADIVLAGALLKQYRHDFSPAMKDLDRVLAAEPANSEAISWQFALHLVRADYASSRKSCEQLKPYSTVLASTACFAVIDSINGQSRAAYKTLATALAAHPAQNAEYRQWALTRLGEMAQRFGDKALAEKHFKEALAVGLVDGFTLAAYADLLLDQNRPAEVLPLLKNFENSDVLLLRLALAADALKSPEAPKFIRSMADRFAASALRGDRLHLQEQARFELSLNHNPAAALKLILDDWGVQREPRDARFLMEAALAAKDPGAAKPALDWMDSTGYEDPLYRSLAQQLRQGIQ